MVIPFRSIILRNNFSPCLCVNNKAIASINYIGNYEISWEPLIGSLLLVVCIIGIILIALNDVTGVGVFDDFLIAPLTFGIERGSSLIFA